MPAHLKILTGKTKDQLVPIAVPRLVLARSGAHELLAGQEPVGSTRYAVIRHEGGGHWLVDLVTSTGTRINGRLVYRQLLQPGDVVTLGETGPSAEYQADFEEIQSAVESNLGHGPVALDGEPTGVRMRLLGVQGRAPGVFTQEYVRIGRDPASDLCLASDTHSMVSSHHAMIRIGEDGVWLYDAQSTNGTYVNGEAVIRAALRTGDRIRFGRNGPEVEAEVIVEKKAARLADRPVVTPAPGARHARPSEADVDTGPTHLVPIGQRAPEGPAPGREEPAAARTFIPGMPAGVGTTGGVAPSGPASPPLPAVAVPGGPSAGPPALTAVAPGAAESPGIGGAPPSVEPSRGAVPGAPAVPAALAAVAGPVDHVGPLPDGIVDLLQRPSTTIALTRFATQGLVGGLILASLWDRISLGPGATPGPAGGGPSFIFFLAVGATWLAMQAGVEIAAYHGGIGSEPRREPEGVRLAPGHVLAVAMVLAVPGVMLMAVAATVPGRVAPMGPATVLALALITLAAVSTGLALGVWSSRPEWAHAAVPVVLLAQVLLAILSWTRPDSSIEALYRLTPLDWASELLTTLGLVGVRGTEGLAVYAKGRAVRATLLLLALSLSAAAAIHWRSSRRGTASQP